jgi:hypothetical protein
MLADPFKQSGVGGGIKLWSLISSLHRYLREMTFEFAKNSLQQNKRTRVGTNQAGRLTRQVG